mmetsp:Transcript_8621/g.14985  ORF Transcript_8621/g.14985 Transcript_8621/m.14985 type:complete len:131 (-) Transcript_8621:357-749(-)
MDWVTIIAPVKTSRFLPTVIAQLHMATNTDMHIGVNVSIIVWRRSLCTQTDNDKTVYMSEIDSAYTSNDKKTNNTIEWQRGEYKSGQHAAIKYNPLNDGPNWIIPEWPSFSHGITTTNSSFLWRTTVPFP